MRILVTGAAGFIGMHLVEKLISNGHEVIGLDNINDYYDIELKYARLEHTGINKTFLKDEKPIQSEKYNNYIFIHVDLEESNTLGEIFKHYKFDAVCNLAAQAGVRYSLENPHAYISSNINGFFNILELCKKFKVDNLCFASSSSVYGLNQSVPFEESNSTSHPMNIYAASKKSNELMAHSYAHLYGIRSTGLRFFTVYGPWGRPDMALFIFTKSILEGNEIEVFNNGEMERDFTYITDIIEGIIRVIENPASGLDENNAINSSNSTAPYKIYNIGNNNPVKLIDFIKSIEDHLGIKAKKVYKPIQLGDMLRTYSNSNKLIDDMNYSPGTSIDYGVKKFIEWYKKYYKIQ